jgi:uncharacterized coiled-coil DUF342 family protein
VAVLGKERERAQLEREEYERCMASVEGLEQEYNSIALERQDLQDQGRRLQAQVEVLQSERAQMDVQLQLLRRAKEEMTGEVASLKDQLYGEQRKFDNTVKQHAE